MELHTSLDFTLNNILLDYIYCSINSDPLIINFMHVDHIEI